jgi:hypothetical protein
MIRSRTWWKPFAQGTGKNWDLHLESLSINLRGDWLSYGCVRVSTGSSVTRRDICQKRSNSNDGHTSLIDITSDFEFDRLAALWQTVQHYHNNPSTDFSEVKLWDYEIDVLETIPNISEAKTEPAKRKYSKGRRVIVDLSNYYSSSQIVTESHVIECSRASRQTAVNIKSQHMYLPSFKIFWIITLIGSFRISIAIFRNIQYMCESFILKSNVEQ